MRYSVLQLLFLLLLASTAKAIPIEGFEVFSLSKSAKSYLVTQISYVNPSWMSDFEELSFYATHPMGGNFFTWGAALTINNRWNDRSAYFLRWDQLFWGQSFSFKLIHRDEKFLGAGKNILALAYNGAFNFSQSTQVYVSVGMNYRANFYNDTWNPINFNTNDREYYFEASLGFKKNMSKNSYYSFDLNNRDPFNSYNADFIAADLTLGLELNSKTTLRLISSTRFSSFWMGTSDIGMQSFMAGIATEF